MEDLQGFIEQLDLGGIAKTVLLVLATWIIGSWIIGRIVKIADKRMEKGDMEVSLRGFLRGFISIALKVALVISIAGIVGIETTSFMAILASAGLAVGLALQGGLSNFAGGVLILIFKPFRIGDYIQAQGQDGTVKDISIFTTTLHTPDNKVVIIPNGPLANGNVTNFNTLGVRRVDIEIGIGYSSDIKKAQEIMMRLMQEDDRVLKDPAPSCPLMTLADSSVNFAVRPWAKSSDYWALRADLMYAIKSEFDKNNIEIPFPQQVVHHINEAQAQLN